MGDVAYHALPMLISLEAIDIVEDRPCHCGASVLIWTEPATKITSIESAIAEREAYRLRDSTDAQELVRGLAR